MDSFTDTPFIANGAINVYLDTGAKLYFVNHAILSIELKEARRIAGLASSGPDAMDTDAPGWGRYEEMSAQDYDDVADDWKRYAETTNDRKRRAEHHERSARADDGYDDDPYGGPASMLEVSALTAFMTMRSGIRKYQRQPSPVVAPLPHPVVPPPPVVAPLPHPVVPQPDTTHVDPKHVAVRLDDDGLPGPSASHAVYYHERSNFQTNHEGLMDEDDDLEIPAEYSYQYSDRSYEDQ
jgi:hypothetical protein